MATIDLNRTGYGQVELNHMSFQQTREIYAQLPAASTITVLENGQFAKYDYAKGVVDTDGTADGEWMLVYNEIKLYDDWRESLKDFAMVKDNYTPGSTIAHDGLGPFAGQMVPRLVATKVGDIFTTNCLEVQGAKNTKTTSVASISDATSDIEAGIYYAPNATTGYLTKQDSKPATGMAWKVVKVYTMPDMQAAVKLQRVQ